ncbi:MAG: HAD-IA family hydrolase [Pseudomonadota bacterium]
MHQTKIKAIVLDAGGVILYPNFDWIATQAASFGIRLTKKELHTGYYRAIYAVDLDKDTYPTGLSLKSLQTWIWLFEKLFSEAGIPSSKRKEAANALAHAAESNFPRESDIYHWTMPNVRKELQTLQNSGFLLAVASNNDGALNAQLTSVGIADLFLVKLDSEIEGVRKPNPELLLRAARALGLSPKECLYIGDVDRVDGAAARGANMHFSLMDPLNQPRPTNPLIIPNLEAICRYFTPDVQ